MYAYTFMKRRHEIANMIEDRSMSVIYYLTKMYFHPDSSNIDYWAEEAYNSFHTMYVQRNNKQFPAVKFIRKYSFEKNKSFIYDNFRYELKLYPDKDLVVEYVKFCKLVDQYFTWLAGELSVGPSVTVEDVYFKFCELGFMNASKENV